MPESSLNRDAEFIYEMGCIRFIQRTWRRFLGPNFANLAEHHFRVAWIAMVIAKHEGDVDYAKMLKMALVHDIPESRTGDVDYLSRQYVERHEDQGIRDMIAGTVLEPEMVDLWEEYERRECIEAKIVKDADNLDVDFELAEQTASGYGTLFATKANMRRQVADKKLYTRTARLLWDKAHEIDPHAWHHNANNRFKTGDWSNLTPDTAPAPEAAPADSVAEPAASDYRLNYHAE